MDMVTLEELSDLNRKLEALAPELTAFNLAPLTQSQLEAIVSGKKDFTRLDFRAALMMPSAEMKAEIREAFLEYARQQEGTVTIRMNSANNQLLVSYNDYKSQKQREPDVPQNIEKLLRLTTNEILTIQAAKFGPATLIEFDVELGNFEHPRASELHGDGDNDEFPLQRNKWLFEILRIGDLPFGYVSEEICSHGNPKVRELIRQALDRKSDVYARLTATNALRAENVIIPVDLNITHTMLPATFDKEGKTVFTPHCSLYAPNRPTTSGFFAWHTLWPSSDQVKI